MDRRLLAAYQMHAPRVPLWRQMLTARTAVPIPVVAAVAIIILGLAIFSVQRGVSAPIISLAPPVVTIEPAAGPVKLVEIPVRREPISTRRLMPAAGGRRRVGERGRRLILASSGRINPHLAARGVEEDTGYFTRVDMKEFRPADAMRIRIIRKGTEDED